MKIGIYKVPISLSFQYKNFVYQNNRMINNERIENATDFKIKDSEAIIITINKNENEFYILDGQHRMTYFMKNTHLYKGNEYILIDVRRIDSEEDFKNLLRKINNRYNFSDEQIHKYRLHLILEQFDNNFDFDVYGKNRPKINKENFGKAIVNLNIYKNFENSVEFICNKLMELNSTLATKKKY